MIYFFAILFLLFVLSVYLTYIKFSLFEKDLSRKEKIARVLESGIELWGGVLALVLAFYFLFVNSNELRFWQVFWFYFIFLFFQGLNFIYDFLTLKKSNRKKEQN